MGARRLISSTGSKRLTGARRVEDVGKQTRSEPVETACPGKSIGLLAECNLHVQSYNTKI